jgi:ppGpp synthetase/RelA/SpoT-type nucleotidyltranferase
MDGEVVRQRWLEEYALLDQFGELLKGRIKGELRLAGVWGDIQTRTKSIDSVLKKLLLKSQYTYESLPDLVGVRVVVRYIPEVRRVSDIVARIFACTDADDKSVRLAEEGVGYLSIHRLRPGDRDLGAYPPNRFHAEVQMRTLAQHLWAEMSHDSFYKSSEGAIRPELKRRTNLMAGLLEVADTEFARLNEEVGELPDMSAISVLRDLERNYFQFTSERTNPDLSLQVINLLLPLYPDWEAIGARIDDFVATRRETIIAVFNSQRDVPRTRSAFFFQPEVLMIYERLEHDPLAVRERWSGVFPESELERVALAFGISFD